MQVSYQKLECGSLGTFLLIFHKSRLDNRGFGKICMKKQHIIADFWSKYPKIYDLVMNT